MKAKVKLTYSVELIVEGDNEDIIMNWLLENTPSEAYECARKNGKWAHEDYNEEILNEVDNDVEADYVI